MGRSLALASLLLLAGCGSFPQTPADVELTSNNVVAGCQAAMAVATPALVIPNANLVAAGVIAGCGSAAGVAKLLADPSSAAWLAQQEVMLAGAIKSVQAKI
jgi:hypothetical protein